jgi:PEGA domain
MLKARRDFRGFEDSNGRIRGDVSGTANTDTRCQTTFTPPTETTLTHYDRVNYIIAKGEHALYMLSCTQHWKPTKKNRALGVLIAGTVGNGEATDKLAQAPGTWTECPAFAIGVTYALSVQNTSDARLVGTSTVKPFKLDYLGSAVMPVSTVNHQSAQPQPAVSAGSAKVHITSTPSGGEIYIDGKFFGNTPSDFALAPGEHVVRVTLGGKEWTRTVQITGGEIQLRAELP